MRMTKKKLEPDAPSTHVEGKVVPTQILVVQPRILPQAEVRTYSTLILDRH